MNSTDPFAVAPSEIAESSPGRPPSSNPKPENVSNGTPPLASFPLNQSNSENKSTSPVEPLTNTKLLPLNPPFIYHGHNKNDNTNPIPSNEKLQELLKETLASPGRNNSLARFLKYTEPLPPVVIDSDDSSTSITPTEDPYTTLYTSKQKNGVKSAKNGKGLLPDHNHHHHHHHARQELLDDIDPLQFFVRQAQLQQQLPQQYQHPQHPQHHHHPQTAFYSCCAPSPNGGFVTMPGSTPSPNPSPMSLSLSHMTSPIPPGAPVNGYYSFPAPTRPQIPSSLAMNHINNNTLGSATAFFSSSDFSAAILAGIQSNSNIISTSNTNIPPSSLNNSNSNDKKRSSMDHDMSNDASSSSNDNCHQCESVPTQVQSNGLVPSGVPPLQPVAQPIEISNNTNNNNSNNPNAGAIVPVTASTAPNPSTPPSTQLVPRPDEEFVYLTEEFLNLPQSEAARKLGLPTSSLSKKWKEVAGERKWPYRTVCKLDKEIATLIEANTSGKDAPTKLPPDVEQTLGLLIRRRSQELRTVLIRLKKKDYVSTYSPNSSSTGS